MISLGKYRWMHSIVAALPIYSVAGTLLRRFPLEKRIKPGDLVYRITSLDQISTQTGIFDLNEYQAALDGSRIATFIDLGCNAGWFTLWLTARLPDPPVAGLLVDAHPLMVSEAAWHLKRNRLPNCIVVHGAVGLPPDRVSTQFHIHPSSTASSVVSYQPLTQLPVKGRITDVIVPAISVSEQWPKHFGEAIVDLMKIDIEGSELDFISYEGGFLRERVRRIVLEWHKWCVSLSELDAGLASIGFEQRHTYDQSPQVGLAVYQNSATLQ
jgi:FkbM family methyltransferase